MVKDKTSFEHSGSKLLGSDSQAALLVFDCLWEGKGLEFQMIDGYPQGLKSMRSGKLVSI